MSSLLKEAALPKRNLSSPACAAFPECWMEVSSKIPIPKKTESTIPIAVSLFNLVDRLIASIIINESHPEIHAPIIRYKGFLFPVKIKDKQTPGKIEWAIASPTRALFLKNEKQPTTAAVAPSIIVPSTTISTLGSEKLKNLKVLFTVRFYVAKLCNI